MLSKEINEYQDVIDSRVIIDRISYLSDDDDLDENEIEELAKLVALAKEGEEYSTDWIHGEAIIRYSYFKQYAQELAEEIGAVTDDVVWPNNCIDWDEAARELSMDYTSIDFGDVEYFIRS